MIRRAMPVGTLGQRGFLLLEVLIASIVVGITVLGVSLMLFRAPAFTVSAGTSQAELYLAEQKLEKLRAQGFLNASVLGSEDAGANDGCDLDSGEPCYNETGARALHGGAVTNGQPQSFERLTCVDYVSDSGPPYPAVCAPNPGSSTATKRIQVKVKPFNQSGFAQQAEFAKAGDITFDMILVNPPLNAVTP